MYKLNLILKNVFILALIFAGFTQTVFGQESAPSDSLKNVLIGKEAEMFHAMTTGDRVAAERIIGPDYITINADGVMEDRAEMMKTFGKFKGATFTLSDKRIRTYGDIAIITGGAKFYIKSILAAKVFYTETWIYRNNQWYFIGWQGTMTGISSYYSIILTILGLVFLYFIAWLIIRKTTRRRLKTA